MKGLKIAVVSGAAVLTLSGCGMLSGGVYDTPLPGGADLGSSPMTIEADFEDVLDLVPQSSVKVDNVAVGRVEKIRLNTDGHSARVKLKVNGKVDLPAGTTARLQQTSLLGEKYVALVRPEAPVMGDPVRSGDKLALDDTSQAAQVEQVLGALSLVLNGGGIGQFQEISRELQQISEGRPDQIKGFLEEMNTFVSGLDDRKGAITDALDGLNRLSKTLDADKDKITRVLDDLSPGMKVLVDQREQFVGLLKALDRLSGVTVDTLDKAQEDIIADFEALEPILQQLAKAGSDLPNSLEILLTYPFPDSVLGAIKGDYMNVFIETNYRTVPTDCAAIGCAWPQPVSSGAVAANRYKPGSTSKKPAPPTLLPPTSSPIPGVPEPTITVPTPSPSASAPSPSATVDPTPSTDPSTPEVGDSATTDPARADKDGDS